MNIKIILVLLLTIISSCGTLGIHKDDINRDPDFQAKAIAELNNTRIAKEMDSLIVKIDAASLMIPEDLNHTTLIVETYEYNDFLKTRENKFHTPKDDSRYLREYEKYKRNKTSLVKNPKYKIAYVDKGKFETFDTNDYRYVLKTSNRIDYDPDHLTVTNEGFVYPFVTKIMYYIYDRKTHRVFKEIVDLSVLNKLR